MSGFFRAQVTIPLINGIPEDSIVNVWHFDSDQTFAEDADDVVGRLRTFYQAIDDVVLSGRVSNATVKMYDLADPEPRIPHITDTIVTSPGADATVMPHEVAICLSMAAAPQSGVSPGRLRGRIFLGPCRATAFQVSGSRITVKADVQDAIVDAAVALAKGPDAGDARLAVYSPTTHAGLGGGAGSLGDAFNDVVRVWVDDAPDTIRSRGSDPVTRTSADII